MMIQKELMIEAGWPCEDVISESRVDKVVANFVVGLNQWT